MRQKHLLIVSDDPSICRLFSEALPKPVQCDAASTADAAMARLEERDYTILVLDLTSPTTKAYELLQHLQKRERAKRPLTFVLVDDMSSLPQKLDPKVVTMVIAKPFDTADISGIMRQTLISLAEVASEQTLRDLEKAELSAGVTAPEPSEPRLTAVLVVDDDRSVQNLIVAALRREGLEPYAAADGSQAIERLRTGRYCAVILDLMMPKMSGWDVITWLKGNPSHTPHSVIVSTAADRAVLHELDPDVVNAIFVKPFNLLELVGYIQACSNLPARDRRRKRVIGAEREIQR